MQKSIAVILGLYVATMGLASSASAVDVQQLSNRCVSCHGSNGIGTTDNYPNLAGQKSAYLLKQMQDFQTGKRNDPIMTAMLKGLSENDLKALADYYNQIK